jgi:hypothetical protein
VRPEELMTSSEIEPAAFWLVAQYLNQLRHRIPPVHENTISVAKSRFSSNYSTTAQNKNYNNKKMKYTTLQNPVTSRWPSSPHASNEINGRRYMCPD